VVATWVCRVYEVLSVSLGLVLIPCVNALASQRVGNVELSDVAGVFPGTVTVTGTMCICRRPLCGFCAHRSRIESHQ